MAGCSNYNKMRTATQFGTHPVRSSQLWFCCSKKCFSFTKENHIRISCKGGIRLMFGSYYSAKLEMNCSLKRSHGLAMVGDGGGAVLGVNTYIFLFLLVEIVTTEVLFYQIYRI